MDINYPGFGSIVVQGVTYDHDVILEGGAVRPRRKKPSRPFRDRYGHTPLSSLEELPWGGARLIIGCGHSGRLPIMDEVRGKAAGLGVELIVMPTADACQLIRTLDDSEVNAVLHVTC
jgi:hypothetical protein